jgi:hypothetical protein
MTRSELLTIVRSARDLISDPAKWNSRTYAEDAQGHWVPVGSDRAVSFDLRGALVRAAGISSRAGLGAIFQVFADTSPKLFTQMNGLLPLRREQALELLDGAIDSLSRASITVGEAVMGGASTAHASSADFATQGRDSTAHTETTSSGHGRKS